MALAFQVPEPDTLNGVLRDVDQVVNQLSSISSSSSIVGAEYAKLLVDILQSLHARMSQLQSTFSTLDTYALGVFVDAARDFVSVLSARLMQTKHGTSEDITSNWPPERNEIKELVSSADGLLCLKVRPKVPEPPPVLRSSPAPPMLFVYKLEKITNRLFPPATLGPWINLGDLRKWLDHCDKEHTEHCQLSQRNTHILPMRPRWLIDVHRLCLVPASPAERYAALSYVWGTATPFRTLKSSLDRFQHEGSLDHCGWPPSLENQPGAEEATPRTIFDAISLTRLIGERYLWVDSLCIIQDDEDDKMMHLSNMGSIYGNAYVTIVAAAGTAFDGLRGINAVTPPMERPVTAAWYARRQYTLHNEIRNHHQRMQSSIWNTRAWTFQEQIFSRRLLIFEEKSVSWECHCAVWFEGMEELDGQCKDQRKAVAPGLSMSLDANLNDYARHLQQYTKRALTFPEDVLDAFNGILGALNSVYRGKFICGLPEMFFDAALLWYNESPLRRRKARKPESSFRTGTWSWAAWEGAVTLGEPVISPESIETLVRWTLGADPDSHRYTIPPFRPAKGKVATEEPSTNSVIHLQTSMPHILFARAERLIFQFLELMSPVQILLKGKSDECVGMLTSCESLNDTTETRRRPYELVAVSKQTFNYQVAYNVLWIEREGQVAYRRGVGRILESVWKNNNPDEIDLVLG